VPRPRESEALVSLLLADGGATRPTALRGPGGFGKSSLAAALCHDDRLIEAFDDGILWTTLGPAPNLLAEMQKLYGALTGERPGFVDVDDASRELAQRLEGKNCLIVIDDAWSPAHLRPFLFAGGPKQLVTTRVFDVAMGCERIDLDRMEDDESLQLLLTRAELQPADAGAYRRLARRLGDWPLTLKLAGSAIRQRVARGDTPERALDFVERALDKRGMTAFDRDGAIDRGATVESTLAPSLGLLGAEAERRYTELAVFVDAEAVPLAAVEALWQLDDFDTEDLARRLDDLALAELDLRRGTLRVHSRVLVGHLHVVPLLPDFLARYPEVNVDLMMSNRVIDVVEQNIDVDIRIGKLVDSSLVARKLATSERIVCAAPRYLDKHAAIEAPADLAAHNCLTYRINVGRTVWRFLDAAGALQEIPVTGNLTMDNGYALLSATLAGAGVALMPDWSVRDDLAAGRLRRILPGFRASHVEFDNGIYAVFQKSRHMSAKVRAFIDYLAEAFEQRLR